MKRIAIVLVLAASALVVPGAQSGGLVISGATVIDGNGGAPLLDAVVVINDGRIASVAPRSGARPPAGTQVVDGTGKFVVPGFVDTNVHLSLYGGMNDRYETLVRYADRQPEIVLEAAQIQLSHGVTTVRDSYGMLRPLVATR